MNRKIFNIALVGCGTISFNHLTAIERLKNVNVVALCDINAEKSEKRRAEFNLS